VAQLAVVKRYTFVLRVLWILVTLGIAFFVRNTGVLGQHSLLVEVLIVPVNRLEVIYLVGGLSLLNYVSFAIALKLESEEGLGQVKFFRLFIRNQVGVDLFLDGPGGCGRHLSLLFLRVWLLGYARDALGILLLLQD